jgi:hypothetical protein
MKKGLIMVFYGGDMSKFVLYSKPASESVLLEGKRVSPENRSTGIWPGISPIRLDTVT